MDIILYLLSIIQYLYQQNCWLIRFICRYIPLKQWVFDDSHSPKYQKFKVDELLTSEPLSNRTGSFSWNTTSGSMANPLSLFNAETAALSRKMLSVLCAVHPITFATITMAVMDSIGAKSVPRPSVPVILLPLPSGCCALTAGRLWWQRKNADISFFTNVSIQNALTISTT